VHQRRRRLTDPDGLHIKSAIDGLVVGGLLGDDSPDWVESVEVTQAKCQRGEEEQTVIEIFEVDDEQTKKQ